MKRVSMFLFAVLAAVACSPAFAESIKLAIIAPDGSAWANVMKEMGEELKQKTGGRWDIKLYAGGVSGDEKVVIKKMQIGQLDAAGFTGVGLGEIYPAIRVLELPFLFNDSSEVDHVVRKLMPDIGAAIGAKGYEFLGWAEAGFVNIFSNKPLRGLADMKGVKMWMWEGDPLASKFYETLGIVPVPLSPPDVLMALQTKMIDGVYAPPLAAIAMQWFSKTRYMNDANLVNSIGALLITKKAFSRMSAGDQAALRMIADKYTKKIVDITRRDNVKAVETLKKAGVEITKVDDRNLGEIKEKSRACWTSLAGNLYPKELLDRVLGLIEESRKKG